MLNEDEDSEEGDGEGRDDEEDTTPAAPSRAAPVATATDATRKARELKIVIMLKENRAIIGVQSPDADPIYETMQGTMEEVIERIPKTVEFARARWAVSKKNPQAELPTPLPADPRPASTPRIATSRPIAAKPRAQPKFF